jgi:hypothetical protein
METLFKSKTLSKKVKEKLYISYIRPVLTYACTTWFTTKGDEEKLRRFERKILRRIYGPVFNTKHTIMETEIEFPIRTFIQKGKYCAIC